MWYVNIQGVDDQFLEFLGYNLVHEDHEFKLYVDYHGEDHLVLKVKPRLLVEDLNDAALLADKATGPQSPQIIAAPPNN